MNESEMTRLQKENDILRGLVAKYKPECIYCGETELAKCSYGFPGCSKADDIFIAVCLVEKEILRSDVMNESEMIRAYIENLKCCGNCKHFTIESCPMREEIDEGYDGVKLHTYPEPNERCDNWTFDRRNHKERIVD